MAVQPVDHAVAAALSGDAQYLTAALAQHPSLLYERNMFGADIAHAAVHGGHPELLELPAFAEWTPGLLTVAGLGDLAAVRQALAADPGQASDFIGSTTALHASVYWGQLEVARLLLESGADAIVNAPSRDDFLQITPLGSAIASTPGIPQPSDDETVVLALVRLLLEHGADVRAVRKDGLTPLHAAAWRGHGAVAQLLLDAGADPAATATAGPHVGQRPADTALSEGHLVLAARLDRAAE